MVISLWEVKLVVWALKDANQEGQGEDHEDLGDEKDGVWLASKCRS